jgi:hypothetical protein
MKKSINSLYNPMSSSQMQTLTGEVKETIAQCSNAINKPFTTTDMWNIQRNAGVRIQRRYF